MGFITKNGKKIPANTYKSGPHKGLPIKYKGKKIDHDFDGGNYYDYDKKY